MKRTKSMVYTVSVEADDLFLYTVNTSELYNRYAIPIIKNLLKKVKAGTYNKEKAIDSFYNLAMEGVESYYKEFPDTTHKFTVTEKYTCACDLEAHYMSDYVEGFCD